MRMYWDYFWYITMLKKKDTCIILVDFGIFLVTVYAFIEQVKQYIHTGGYSFTIILLFALAAIKFIWDCYKMYTDYASYNRLGIYSVEKLDRIVDERGVYNLSELKPSRAEEDRGFVMLQIPCQDERRHAEYVLHSSVIDHYIRHTELSLVPDQVKYLKVRRLIKERSETLLPFLTFNFYQSRNNNKYFFNEQKLCLSDDLRISSDSVKCHRGSYYDTYLTNIVSMQKLVQASDGHDVIFDGRKLYPYGISDAGLRLFDITASEVNNEIGISTLAFTKDNYLVLWNQNVRAQSSGNLMVPSGSGSADWNDIVGSSFTKSIQKGMNRELKEESSLHKFSVEQLGDTRVIGFFRWIRKAGKPEFLGITKMNVEYNHIQAELREVAQVRNTDPVLVETLEQLRTSLDEVKRNPDLSVPLYMNILALEGYIEREPEEVAAFLRLRV